MQSCLAESLSSNLSQNSLAIRMPSTGFRDSDGMSKSSFLCPVSVGYPEADRPLSTIPRHSRLTELSQNTIQFENMPAFSIAIPSRKPEPALLAGGTVSVYPCPFYVTPPG
jgi:hypothetical protein